MTMMVVNFRIKLYGKLSTFYSFGKGTELDILMWCESQSALAPSLIETAAADVTHPLNDIVIGVVELGFEYLQVADLLRSKMN